MGRKKNLYQRIPAYENLALAFLKAAKGKKDKSEVDVFRKDFETNIQRLRRQLIAGKPDIGHYRYFTVRDPKVRKICAAAFPEQVLHHAVMNVCEPVLESYAIFDSYACRKGKGNRKALARTQSFARKYDWYLKLDIHKYFDSIDHAIVIRLLAKRFKDLELLSLFEKLLDTYHTSPNKGVPIGNLISQHLANFYLGRLDHWIKDERGVKGYLRYMDDFIIFHYEKAYLKRELAAIERFLKDELSLTLKDDIRLNRCCMGIPFLGFRVFPAHIRLSPKSLRRFSKKFRQYEQNYLEGRWHMNELVRHMQPLFEFTKGGDTLQIRRLVIDRFGVLS